MSWDYKREEQVFEPIPEGPHRIRIKSVEKATSRSGNDMIAFQFDVSGQTQTLYHYIVFLDDKPEITNRNLTQFFDSFKDIEDGDFNMYHWTGKVGACVVKHDEYDGKKTAKVRYFIAANKQDGLAPWREPDSKDSKEFSPTDDLPF